METPFMYGQRDVVLIVQSIVGGKHLLNERVFSTSIQLHAI
jgi:hypothetical protein